MAFDEQGNRSTEDEDSASSTDPTPPGIQLFGGLLQGGAALFFIGVFSTAVIIVILVLLGVIAG